MNNNGIALPKGETMTYEECLENLKHTRDFDLYLDMLNALKDKYLIVMCIRETSGRYISDTSIEKIQGLGFSNNMTYPRRMYVGVSDKGNIICSSIASEDGEPVRFEEAVGGIRLSVSSEVNAAEIVINGADCSLDERGLNFAVYDGDKSEIVDVSCYDGFVEKPTFYHCNFYLSDRYIDSHIYMPEKYLGNMVHTMKRSYFSNRKLNVREVERGIFLTSTNINGKTCGGVCDEYFNFVDGHQLFDPDEKEAGDNRHIWDSYTPSPEDIDYVDETVLYAGTMMNHPGQMIVECFADRLWWLAQNPDSSLKIAVESLWNDTGWSQGYAVFIKEFLDAFGISEDRIVFVKKPTQFKKIIIPDQSSICLHWSNPYEYTAEFIQAFRHISKQSAPSNDKKIYLTKTHTARQNIVGEGYFIDFLQKRGFRIVHPEEYTIKEKAAILYNADEVVTMDGTNFVYSVFCKPTVRLTMLTRMPNYFAILDQQIIEATGIKEVYLVNVSGNFLSKFADDVQPYSTDNKHPDIASLYNTCPIFMCVTEEFKKYVKDVFNEELDITAEEYLRSHLYEYFSLLPDYFSEPYYYQYVKDFKIQDILNSISEIIYGKEFDTSKLDLSADSSKQKETKEEKKLRDLSEKIYVLTKENTSLENSLVQLEAEGEQLRSDYDKLCKTLLAAYRQKDEAGEQLLEIYRRVDTLTKQLLQVTEERSALAARISELNSEHKRA